MLISYPDFIFLTIQSSGITLYNYAILPRKPLFFLSFLAFLAAFIKNSSKDRNLIQV